MTGFDDDIGVLLKKLDDLGIAENTIVIISTGNGAEEFSWPDGGTTPFRGEKTTTWEGGCVTKPGTVINDIFSGMDCPRVGGSNEYIMHFDKSQTPPVNGFWSLTMYDAKYFFVPNPLNRYTLSSRFKFKYNKDGSLDFYIQKDSPGKDKESNWLPAPADNFDLMLRFYWPKESIIDGTWKPPAVQLVK